MWFDNDQFSTYQARKLRGWGAPVVVRITSGEWIVGRGVNYVTNWSRIIDPWSKAVYFELDAGPFETREAAKAAYIVLYGDQHD